MSKILNFIILPLFLFGCNESYSDKYTYSNSKGSSVTTPVVSTVGPVTTPVVSTVGPVTTPVVSTSIGGVNNWLKTTLGLSSKDACKIMERNSSEAQDIYNKSNKNLLIFQLMLPFSDSYFQPGGKKPGPGGSKYILEDWDSAQKLYIKQKFARMIFLLNTSKFKQVYESISKDIEPQSSPNNVAIPQTTEELRRHIIDYSNQYNNEFKVFVSETRTKVAWGVNNLTIFVEDDIGTPLLLHEFMHSIGFDHDGIYANGNPAKGPLDNIPYGVQTIIGQNDTPVNAKEWGKQYGIFSNDAFGLQGFYFGDFKGSKCK